MSLDWKFVIVGLCVSVAGGWLIFGTGSDQSSTAGDLTSESIDALETEPDSESAEQGNDTNDPSQQEEGANQERRPSGEELAGLTLQTIPTPTTIEIEDESDCDADYGGLGVEYRAWGDVLLPYTPGYPTSEPGQVWNCTAETAFGAAIAMVHAAYLEALRPDVIPSIALAGEGRAARIEAHTNTNSAASLGYLCSPIGWNWDGDSTWSLLHQCGEGEPRVSYYEMTFQQDRWWLVYPSSGLIESEPPPSGYQYYAFIGGE